MSQTPALAPESAVDIARRIYQARRRRDALLGRNLFGEPAWEILLELYIARSQDRLVSCLSASIAAFISLASAVQCLSTLQECGLVEPLYPGHVSASTVVMLSDHGFERMTALLTSEPDAPPRRLS